MFRLRFASQYQLSALLFASVLLGGGGIAYGLRHLSIQLLALLILAMNFSAMIDFARNAPRSLLVLVILSVAWPMAQVIPLPPSIWQALPGRELIAQSYAAANIASDSWFSASLDPIRTLTAFCSTIVPATMIIVGWSLTADQRHTLVRSLGVAALAALMLGAIQLASANTAMMLQDIDHKAGYLYATFSNHNSTGLFFLISATVLLGLPQSRTVIGPAIKLAVILLLTLAVIVTRSRSAMVLLLVFFSFAMVRGAAAWSVNRRVGARFSRNSILAGGAAILVGIAAVAASVAAGGQAADSFQRFAQVETDRLEMWDDGAFVASRYWPAGAGTGAFGEVFQADESLEYVSPAKAGRAHNDYLELAIESGVIGLLLLAGWFAWLAHAMWRRRHDPDRWLAAAAMVSFVAIALQSVLDYPLRNEAMLCVAGLLVVLMMPQDRDSVA